jgi:hypothetical protein
MDILSKSETTDLLPGVFRPCASNNEEVKSSLELGGGLISFEEE